MTKPDLIAKTAAVLVLAKERQLDALPQVRRYLAVVWAETMDGILAWHQAQGPGPIAWCEDCGELRMRKHRCE